MPWRTNVLEPFGNASSSQAGDDSKPALPEQQQDVYFSMVPVTHNLFGDSSEDGRTLESISLPASPGELEQELGPQHAESVGQVEPVFKRAAECANLGKGVGIDDNLFFQDVEGSTYRAAQAALGSWTDG